MNDLIRSTAERAEAEIKTATEYATRNEAEDREFRAALQAIEARHAWLAERR